MKTLEFVLILVLFFVLIAPEKVGHVVHEYYDKVKAGWEEVKP